mgnify:FL=1
MSNLNQKLEQKLLQKLSPQQIQLIKLLEVPIVELEQRIKKEIEENPALEELVDENERESENNDQEIEDFEKDTTKKEEDNEFEEEEEKEKEEKTEIEEFDIENYYDDEDETPDYKLTDHNYSEEDTNYIQNTYTETISLSDYLEEQINLFNFDEKESYVAYYIIGNVDEDGYFRRELGLVQAELMLYHNEDIAIEVIENVFNRLQNELDPSGVLSRDIRECLLIQIKRKITEEPENEKIYRIAYTIIEEYFDFFSKKHFEKIANKMQLSNEVLKQTTEFILKLNPKPGNNIIASTKKNIYQIIPDFLLEIIENEIRIHLNNMNIPYLRINRDYEHILKDLSKNSEKNGKNKDSIIFIKQKIDSAKWFIEALEQRQNTLLRCMESIVNKQKDFFITGDESKLKPMILKDIAEKTNLDISTISRVANSKYVQTPWGIYSLKSFFSEGMETEEGDEVSTKQIKQILKEAIDSEDKSKPLTDDKLAQILKEKGFNIARRTVAKYREQLGILVARLRKQMK